MRSKATYVLCVMIVLSILQAMIFTSVRSSIVAAFDRYPDRVATFTTQIDANQSPAQIARELEQVNGVALAGWSRKIGNNPAETDQWKANNSVASIEVDPNFTQILLEGDASLQCDSCHKARVVISDQIQLTTNVEIGTEIELLSKDHVFAGTFPKPVRGLGLTSSALIPAGSFEPVADEGYFVTLAVLHETVPSREDVRAMAAVVNPNNPQDVQIEAAVISSSNEGSILETIDSSSDLFGRLIKLVSLSTAALIGFFGQTSQRKELASLRSLGACPQFLHKRLVSFSGGHVLGAVLLAALVISIIQPLVVAVAATYYVPVDITAAALTTLGLAAVYMFTSFLGLWVATAKDPAEVLRDA